ncbi:unnamed protein product [Leuciscus chuanchicus]
MLTESRSVNVESRGLAFLEASVQLPKAFPPARVIQASSTETMGYSKTLWICSRASLHGMLVSRSLSSRVKPCRLAQALESLGSGLLLPWEQVPERCCQLFPASSFAVVCLQQHSRGSEKTKEEEEGRQRGKVKNIFLYISSAISILARSAAADH